VAMSVNDTPLPPMIEERTQLGRPTDEEKTPWVEVTATKDRARGSNPSISALESSSEGSTGTLASTMTDGRSPTPGHIGDLSAVAKYGLGRS